MRAVGGSVAADAVLVVIDEGAGADLALGRDVRGGQPRKTKGERQGAREPYMGQPAEGAMLFSKPETRLSRNGPPCGWPVEEILT